MAAARVSAWSRRTRNRSRGPGRARSAAPVARREGVAVCRGVTASIRMEYLDHRVVGCADRRCDGEYHVDPDRIYLAGLSMGGYGAWQYAMEHPEKLAALVPSAPAPSHRAPVRSRICPSGSFTARKTISSRSIERSNWSIASPAARGRVSRSRSTQTRVMMPGPRRSRIRRCTNGLRRSDERTEH